MTTNSHEGNELALLLAGTKPLARLTSEPSVGFVPEHLYTFAPYVENGTLINVNVTKYVRTSSGEEVPIISHYFCLPTEEWRIKLLEVMNEVMSRPNKGGFTTDDLHRMDGHLLGYAKADIETFVANSQKRRAENRKYIEEEQRQRALNATPKPE